MPELLGVTWARPLALLLVALAALPLVAHHTAWRRAPRLRLPGTVRLARGPRGVAARLGWIPAALVALATALVAAALARPQSAELRPTETTAEGIDIVVALDLSASMRAADFRPQDRMQVAREVLDDFVASRTRDRLGLVVFAANAWIAAPLTSDGALVRELIAGLAAGSFEDGTAIGDALATSLNRLRASDAQSRVVVLVTDGDENAGDVAALDAARAAAALGVRVFTVLVGRGGLVPYPVDVDALGRAVYRQVELPVNPTLLRDIAALTGGAHYDAVDRESLRRGLNDILDRLERTRRSEAAGELRREEHAAPLLASSVLLAAVGVALSATRLGRFP